MHFLFFAALAAVCVIGAVSNDNPWLPFVLAYTGAAFASLAVTYLTRRPAWLLKRGSGSRHPLGWAVYLPYILLNGLLFHAQRLLSREVATNELVTGLYLGRLLTARESRLVAPQPVAVIDLAAELTENRVFRRLPGYLLIPVLDATPPSQEQLQQGVDHLRRHLAVGRVYIHCALGHGRSATLAAAFLLATRKSSMVEEAVAAVRAKRPAVRLNAQQVRALRVFADQLKYRASPDARLQN
jgi:protein-tyrosine phosphatase